MNEPTAGWPFSVRLAHWLGAVLVLTALGLGAYMVLLVADPAERFQLTQTHKSIGLIILALTVVRLCRRALMHAPKPEPAARPVLLAAKVTHAGLYLLLLMMPLSGWLMATTTPIRVPTLLFGLLEVPYPLAPNLGAYRLAHAAHIAFALLLVFLIGLHVAAAIVHTLFWRDRTLLRMLRNPVRNRGGDLQGQRLDCISAWKQYSARLIAFKLNVARRLGASMAAMRSQRRKRSVPGTSAR